MELNILRADPAGNITIFVLDQVEKAQRLGRSRASWSAMSALWKMTRTGIWR